MSYTHFSSYCSNVCQGEGREDNPNDKPLHPLCLASVLQVKPKARAGWRGHRTTHFLNLHLPWFTFWPLKGRVAEEGKCAIQAQAFYPKISPDSRLVTSCFFSLISCSCLCRDLKGNVSPLTHIPGFKNNLEADLQRHRCSLMSFPCASNILSCLYISPALVLGHLLVSSLTDSGYPPCDHLTAVSCFKNKYRH